MNSDTLLKLGMLVSALYLAACSEREPYAQAQVIRPVRTTTVTLQNEIGVREFSGVVDADRKVDLAFRVSGSLTELPVLQGDFVQENQLLAKLDQTDFEIQVKAHQADFDRSKKEYERAKTLVERKLIAQADFEKMESQYFIAEAQLAKARQDLAYTTITAPFEGYIARRHIENFSEVAARTPILTLIDLNSLVIRIDVPESVMISARKEGVRPEIFASFEGHETAEYPLTVKEIATQPDGSTQTYPVTLSLPSVNNLNVLPGMSVLVGVRPFEKTRGAHDVAYLPTQAVMEDNQGRYVFIAVPQNGEQAIIERKTVDVGEVSSFGIEVLSGLSTGDEVVTAGMSQITSGMRVLLMASE